MNQKTNLLIDVVFGYVLSSFFFFFSSFCDIKKANKQIKGNLSNNQEKTEV